MGGVCVGLRILGHGTSWKWMVSFTPWPLYLWGRARGTHWLRGWVGPGTCLEVVERRKILSLPELELQPLCRPPIPTALSRLPACRNLNLSWIARLVDTVVCINCTCKLDMESEDGVIEAYGNVCQAAALRQLWDILGKWVVRIWTDVTRPTFMYNGWLC
jgi:hypothetical protein